MFLDSSPMKISNHAKERDKAVNALVCVSLVFIPPAKWLAECSCHTLKLDFISSFRNQSEDFQSVTFECLCEQGGVPPDSVLCKSIEILIPPPDQFQMTSVRIGCLTTVSTLTLKSIKRAAFVGFVFTISNETAWKANSWYANMKQARNASRKIVRVAWWWCYALPCSHVRQWCLEITIGQVVKVKTDEDISSAPVGEFFFLNTWIVRSVIFPSPEKKKRHAFFNKEKLLDKKKCYKVMS